MRKIVLSPAELIIAWKFLKPYCSSNSVLPILEDVMFDVDSPGNITVSTTDLENTCKVHLNFAETDSLGWKMCVPRQFFASLSKKETAPITIEWDNTHNIAVVTYGSGMKQKFTGDNAEDFPRLPFQKEHKTVFVTDLGDKFAQATLFCGTDDMRPAMTGVALFLSKDNNARICSTDAHRLYLHEFGLSNAGNDMTKKNLMFIIPKKALVNVQAFSMLKFSVVGDPSGTVGKDEREYPFWNNIFIDGTYCDKKIGNVHVEYGVRLIEASFPDYAAVIPTENPWSLHLNCPSIIPLLDQAIAVAGKTTHQVCFELKSGGIGGCKISSKDLDFSNEFSADIPCSTFQGEDLNISFNGKLLKDLLKCCPDDIKFEFAGVARAATIRQGGTLMLLMPILINDGSDEPAKATPQPEEKTVTQDEKAESAKVED